MNQTAPPPSLRREELLERAFPVMSPAERAGLAALARRHVTTISGCGVNADLKISCLVAGIAAPPAGRTPE